MFAVLHWFLQAHKLDNEKKTHIPHQCSHQKKQGDYIKKQVLAFGVIFGCASKSG